MKKTFQLLGTVTLASALLLSACGQSNSDEHQKNENNKKTENKSEKKTNEKEKKATDNKKEHESKKDNQQAKDNQEQDYEQQNNQNQQAHQDSNEQHSNMNEQRYDYDNNGVYRTPDEQKAHEEWVNGQRKWAEEQEAKEQKLQDEYFELTDKMYEDGVTDKEREQMEKRQDEILDEVSPNN